MENYGEKWMREVWADPFASKSCLAQKCPQAPCSGFSGSSSRKLGGGPTGPFRLFEGAVCFYGEYVYEIDYKGHIISSMHNHNHKCPRERHIIGLGG